MSPPWATSTSGPSAPGGCGRGSTGSPTTPICCCWPVTSPAAASRPRSICCAGSSTASRCPSSPCSATTTTTPGTPRRSTQRLGEAGIHVLERTSVVIDVDGVSVGIAGTKGFGGGFAGASGSAFGEAEMKAFIDHTQCLADGLRDALGVLTTDVRLALLHYSPIEETLRGERLEIYPFLGSYLLAEAIDDAGCDVAFHGHAHHGTERGVTAGGTRVRNVAQPVIAHPYRVYGVEPRPDAWPVTTAAALAEAV